jgi:hypothetical protein
MRACAIVVLLAVTVSALWCVDGCIDPLSASTSQSSAHLPDEDESRVPCLGVVPFQTEPLGPAAPFWRVLVADQALALPDAPPAPSFDIDHPPRHAQQHAVVIPEVDLSDRPGIQPVLYHPPQFRS